MVGGAFNAILLDVALALFGSSRLKAIIACSLGSSLRRLVDIRDHLLQLLQTHVRYRSFKPPLPGVRIGGISGSFDELPVGRG